MRKEIGLSCACFNLRRAARLVKQRFDRIFREKGITANQFSILMAVYNQKHVVLTRLARMLGMERTTLSRNVSLLTRMGVIAIEVGTDKRERKIAITKNGITLLEKTLPLWQKVQNEVVEVIGRERWDGLLSGLHSVAKTL
ncbi:MAG: MarR family winged helix-turn-helix transcriptional regulator [Deltaproteobacteria bacterium]|nr:MarR family winged helix-turn-helix transcriptional regulator [Deltaproteobacteria bacterium]